MRYLLFFLFISSAIVNAQSLRSLVNDGVDKYEKESYADATVNFKKGLEKEADNFAANYNLGNSLYKQGEYEQAVKAFQNAYSLTEDDNRKAQIMHNIGNTLLKAGKIKESVGAYQNSLKLNPNDIETKYNLSYALKQLQNQQNQNKQNKNDQNKDDKNQDKQQNKDRQQNQQDKQNQDKQDQQNQQQNQENKDQQQKPQQGEQQKQDQLTKEQMQRLLQALKNKEADLQKKLRKQKAKSTNKSKDW